jgi:PAS domain S-box-containing protein
VSDIARDRPSASNVSEDAFRLLVEQVVDYAIFMLDPSGRVATWNAGAERLKGYTADEIIGQHFSRFYPEDDVRAGKCEMELESALRDGRFEDEGRRVRKDGTQFWAHVVITRLGDAQGRPIGFAKVTRDLTERRAREEQRIRLTAEAGARASAEQMVGLLTRLQRLTASLAAASTPAQVADILVNEGTLALHATTGVVAALTDDNQLAFIAERDAPESILVAFERFSPNARVPTATAFRTGKAQWLESPAEYAAAAPDLPPTVPLAGSIAALPLTVRGVVVAVMAFRFGVPRKFARDERALMETFAVQAAQALDRAQAHEDERRTRLRVEALGELSSALSRALTVQDVSRVVVDTVMRAVGADTCTLYELDEQSGDLTLNGERGCNPAILPLIQRIGESSGNPIYRTIATREFTWAENEREYVAFYPQLGALKTEGPRAQAFWAAPLIAEDRAIGLLGMGYFAARRFPAEERDFIATLTRQCAEALLRARRLETERVARAVAERLRASLSTTLRSIGDAVIATDAKGRVTLMNAVAESLTGWTENQAVGRPMPEVFRIVNEKTREPVPSPVDKVLELGAIVGLANHTVLISRDGREFPIDDSGAPIRAGTGAIEGVVLVFRDVSDKKRDEARRAFLEEATVTLAGSLDYETTLSKVVHLAVPVLADWCAVDLVQEGLQPKRVAVAHVNPAKIELAKELQAKYPPLPNAPTGLLHVLRTGRSEFYPVIPDELLAASCVDEEHLRLARELELRSAMIVPLIARGGVLGALSFVFAESGRTYSERDVRFAEDLAQRCAVAIDNARLFASEQQARQSADVANHAKDEFLAVVSHELRTPLNAIMGWAKLMSSNGFDEARRERAVQTIERNSVAMAQLIEDLLDISRIVSGKMRLEVQQVDVARVIAAAVESVRPAADAKGIALGSVFDTRVPALVGDPARLQQIVWNLLSNAVKFTSKGGRVDVILELVDSWGEIRVSDTGKGIALPFLPHVFDAFRQEDASFSRSRGGLGLGLAITRQLVELHGGRIEVASEGEGRGASFTVRLPISAVARNTPPNGIGGARQISAEVAFDRPPQLRGLRVLVVDDEEDARQLVKAILDDCGCVVRLASGVDEAMNMIAAEVPEVLVSDIGMPGRDGYDFIARVRALSPSEGGDLPAAALTAYARAEDRRRMLNAGYSMHISKPVEPAELVAVVASLTRFSHRTRG